MFVAQLAQRHALQWLVCTDVDSSDGDGQSIHRQDRGPIGLELFFFIRESPFPVHE